MPVQGEDGVRLGLPEALPLVGVVAGVVAERVLGGEHVALELDQIGGEVRQVIGHPGIIRARGGQVGGGAATLADPAAYSLALYSAAL